MTQPNAKRPAKLFDFLLKAAPNTVFISILLGIVSGFAYTLIIPLVTQSIQFGGGESLKTVATPSVYWAGFEVSKPHYAYTFFMLCLFILITRTASQVMLQRVAINATRALRLDIYQRISRLPIIDAERIGPSRLHATIANDVPFVMAGATAFPNMLISAATILGLLGFLVYLNVDVFWFIVATILFGIVSYRLPLYFGNRFYIRARDQFDQVQEGIRALIYGAKELKLNRTKREAFMQEALVAHEDIHCGNSKQGNLLVTLAMNYGNLMSFFAIGVATFILSNHYGISTEILVSIVMAMLYITGPLSAILNNISPVVRGSIALRKLNQLLAQMPIEPQGLQSGTIACNSIHLRGVKHLYCGEGQGEGGFALGPVDLSLRSGQVTFLVGGNGSGKSTLGKLLSLHYIPSEGEIRFGDTLVTDNNRDLCRQNICAIYSDFYLFAKLYGVDSAELEELGQYYLEYLALDGKVTIDNGQFSTTALSDGQKRRLALIVMYLENRGIYLFDEWAADQDPQFREVFYTKILPGLRQAGKIVVVISHDDRYFHLADHIIRMEDGKVAEHKQSARAAKPIENSRQQAPTAALL